MVYLLLCPRVRGVRAHLALHVCQQPEGLWVPPVLRQRGPGRGGSRRGGPAVPAVPDGLVPCREKWCHMTQEERDDSLRFNENITFGQLG